jgi:hypothetical protein
MKNLSEEWPEVQKIASEIAHTTCSRINSINIQNRPEIAKEVKGCEYWRQGLLELLIAELEKRV